MMDLHASVSFDANDLLGKRERAITKNRLRQSGRGAGRKLSLLKMKKRRLNRAYSSRSSALGKKNGGASKKLARSTQYRLSFGLPFVPWSRRIRSRVRSSNNSSHASPRLVSYFSKVFKSAS